MVNGSRVAAGSLILTFVTSPAPGFTFSTTRSKIRSRWRPTLSCQYGHRSRKARQALSQSSRHRYTDWDVARANAVTGSDAPGRAAGDIDAGGHGVVNASGGELSLGTRGRRANTDGLQRTVVPAAGNQDHRYGHENTQKGSRPRFVHRTSGAGLKKSGAGDGI